MSQNQGADLAVTNDANSGNGFTKGCRGVKYPCVVLPHPLNGFLLIRPQFADKTKFIE